MSESEKEKKIFLSYCGSRDQELLTGRKKMTLGDMERFSFLTEFFGLESYGLNLWKEFGDEFYFNHMWKDEASDLHTTARHHTKAEGWVKS